VRSKRVRIGGFQKQSLIEFPGAISAVVFTVGCNLRCPYCHNRQLIEPGLVEEVPEETVFEHLLRNKGLLDAVVLTGGEPTLQEDIAEFLREVKSMGYLTKLETNGTRPYVLEELLSEGLLDVVAMDIKAPLDFGRYREVTGGVLSEEEFDGILRSIELLKGSGLEVEFRTTVVPGMISEEDLEQIRRAIGGFKHVIQRYRKPRR